MPIKILACDTWFSKCVRERAGWRCERCDAQHQEGTTGLHCAHFYSRGYWGTRFDPFNAASLCYGCHSYLDRNPVEKLKWFQDWVSEKAGALMLDILLEKAQNTKHGLKKLKKEIASHYRYEFTGMKVLRAEGFSGRLEFQGFL